MAGHGAEGSCLTAPVVLEEPQEKAAGLQMLSLETILLNCSNKGSSIPLKQKEFDWLRHAI